MHLEAQGSPDRACLSGVVQLRELEDKYAECMEMLHEAQEELKNLRNKTMPNTTSRRYHSLGLFPMVSARPLRVACSPPAGGPLTGRGVRGDAWWVGFSFHSLDLDLRQGLTCPAAGSLRT